MWQWVGRDNIKQICYIPQTEQHSSFRHMLLSLGNVTTLYISCCTHLCCTIRCYNDEGNPSDNEQHSINYITQKQVITMIRKHQHPNSPVQVDIWDLYVCSTLEAVYCSWWNGSVWGVDHDPFGHGAFFLASHQILLERTLKWR